LLDLRSVCGSFFVRNGENHILIAEVQDDFDAFESHAGGGING
jgi:hypothetical protein